MLFAEVGAAIHNLSSLATCWCVNTLQSFLFIVENCACICALISAYSFHRRQRADEQNKNKTKCTLTSSQTNPRAARLKSKQTPFASLTLTFCGTLQAPAIAHGQTIGR